MHGLHYLVESVQIGRKQNILKVRTRKNDLYWVPRELSPLSQLPALTARIHTHMCMHRLHLIPAVSNSDQEAAVPPGAGRCSAGVGGAGYGAGVFCLEIIGLWTAVGLGAPEFAA